MEELKKNKPVLIAGGVTLLFFALAVSSCLGSAKLKATLTKESSARFDLEKERYP